MGKFESVVFAPEDVDLVRVIVGNLFAVFELMPLLHREGLRPGVHLWRPEEANAAESSASLVTVIDSAERRFAVAMIDAPPHPIEPTRGTVP